MVAYFETDWRFDQSARRQLKAKLSELALSDLEATLNDLRAFWDSKPRGRREQLGKVKELRSQLVTIRDSVFAIDEQAFEEVRSQTRGKIGPTTFRDFADELSICIDAARRAEKQLSRAGSGPDTEFRDQIIERVWRVFSDNNLQISAKSGDEFTQVTEIACEAMGIKKGEGSVALKQRDALRKAVKACIEARGKF
jgi:hypothetical protein